jgi:hypothetical protein
MTDESDLIGIYYISKVDFVVLLKYPNAGLSKLLIQRELGGLGRHPLPLIQLLFKVRILLSSIDLAPQNRTNGSPQARDHGCLSGAHLAHTRVSSTRID